MFWACCDSYFQAEAVLLVGFLGAKPSLHGGFLSICFRQVRSLAIMGKGSVTRLSNIALDDFPEKCLRQLSFLRTLATRALHSNCQTLTSSAVQIFRLEIVSQSKTKAERRGVSATA